MRCRLDRCCLVVGAKRFFNPQQVPDRLNDLQPEIHRKIQQIITQTAPAPLPNREALRGGFVLPHRLRNPRAYHLLAPEWNSVSWIVSRFYQNYFLEQLMLTDWKCDIMCFCETWLSPLDMDNSLLIDGFSFFHRDRNNGSHGGLLVYVKSEYAPCTFVGVQILSILK